MSSGIERNIEKLKKRGLIPSMTKGKPRWRITYATGNQEICMTNKKVKESVQSRNVIKVEKKKVIIKLKEIQRKTSFLKIKQDGMMLHTFTSKISSASRIRS